MPLFHNLALTMLFAPRPIRRPKDQTTPYTTRLTYGVTQLPAQNPKAVGTVLAYLEESFQPPDLKDTLADQDSHLEYTPPLHSCVCALGGIAVGSFADYNVRLFILDLSK